jgi:integrase
MDRTKLTKRIADAAEPRDSRYTIFDSVLSGFGLRVFPSGAKSWVLEYRPGEGGRRVAKRRVTIGRYGDLTPEQARKAAEKLLASVRMGQDPQGEKSALRASPTVAELAAAFMEGHVQSKRKAKTGSLYEGLFRRTILPAIGNLKARDLTRARVAKLHLSLRDTPYQANRVVAVIGSMYGYGQKHGLVPEGLNPARGIEKFAEKARERFLSVSELERLGAAIREAETDGTPWQTDPTKKSKHLPKGEKRTRIGTHAAAALRLLIFTGARLREILHLRWSEVDLERGLLLLPDSKTGQKAIVLNAPAMAVLAQLPRVGTYVIAGDSAGTPDEKPRSDLKKPWRAVSKHAGLEGLRLHDLRHNFAAFGAGGGMGLPIIGKLLGHSQPQTTARYAHLDADPLRRASNAIGSTLAAAMGERGAGATEPSSTTVVPLRPWGAA